MATGLFAFVAHPDLFANAYLAWDAEAEACSRAILAAAADLSVPLEINGYGMRKPEIETREGVRRKYPWRRFWELAGE
jgi:histidinol-phosphatase (PHP family)